MALTIFPMPLQLEVDKRHAARLPVKRRYDRVGAMLHAKSFWNRHCCDGYVAVKKKGTPPYREVFPGAEFVREEVRNGERKEHTFSINGDRVPWDDLDDCTHFTSCCIGRPYDAVRLRPMLVQDPGLSSANAPRMYAGGLNIRSTEKLGARWLYGIVGAPVLVSFLRQPHVAKVTADCLEKGDERLQAAVRALQPGDVIALRGPRDYTHVLVYDGDRGVYAHTACRDGIEWNTWNDCRYTCIHINDELEDR